MIIQVCSVEGVDYGGCLAFCFVLKIIEFSIEKCHQHKSDISTPVVMVDSIHTICMKICVM